MTKREKVRRLYLPVVKGNLQHMQFLLSQPNPNWKELDATIASTKTSLEKLEELL